MNNNIVCILSFACVFLDGEFGLIYENAHFPAFTVKIHSFSCNDVPVDSLTLTLFEIFLHALRFHTCSYIVGTWFML